MGKTEWEWRRVTFKTEQQAREYTSLFKQLNPYAKFPQTDYKDGMIIEHIKIPKTQY